MPLKAFWMIWTGLHGGTPLDNVGRRWTTLDTAGQRGTPWNACFLGLINRKIDTYVKCIVSSFCTTILIHLGTKKEKSRLSPVAYHTGEIVLAICRFAITQFFQTVAWRTRSHVSRVRAGQRALENSLDS